MEGSKRFHQILHELGKLHDEKQQDYGTPTDHFANVRASENWGIPAWVGGMVRATDKLNRLQTYAKRGHLANESVEDSFRDLAVHTIIALVLWEEARAQKIQQAVATTLARPMVQSLVETPECR